MDISIIVSAKCEFAHFAREALELMKNIPVDTNFETELLLNASLEIIENKQNTKEQFLKYIGYSYMAQGIIQHLRLQSPSEILQQAEEVL